MSLLQRLFRGGPPPDESPAPSAPPDLADSETATVRKIVAQLDAMPPDRARLLAGAAYVVSRAANADLAITPDEVALMERTLIERTGVSEAEAVVIVEIARQQARLFGSTEDYLVTREFKRVSTPEQRLGVLRACFLVAASDDEISSPESAVLNEIAAELDVEPAELDAIRAEHRDQLSVVRAARAIRAAEPGA
ncbi:MAG: TerB family tellurite resistance protein [Chloroflexi bacterium]|nr:TerB family tellurite resistance protein [Chloroflexota bacterium]MDA8236515.1 TerB family tellurite resistance protein [Chloroflexota bacterium]